MMRLRLAIAVLALALSACSGQGSLPAAATDGATSGLREMPNYSVREMPNYGVRAMPGYGVRAMPADGETETANAPASNPREDPVTMEGPSSVDLHSPMLP
jgi:hypothetical protein